MILFCVSGKMMGKRLVHPKMTDDNGKLHHDKLKVIIVLTLRRNFKLLKEMRLHRFRVAV